MNSRNYANNKGNKNTNLNKILIDIELIFTKAIEESNDNDLKSSLYDIKKKTLETLEQDLNNLFKSKSLDISQREKFQYIPRKNNNGFEEKIKKMEKEYKIKEKEILTQKDKELNLRLVEINKLKEEHKLLTEKFIKMNEELEKKNEEANFYETLKTKNIFLESLVKENEDDLRNYRKRFKEIEDIVLLVNSNFNKSGYKAKNEEAKANYEDNTNNLGLVGIKNEQLNCYMSSVLQILKNIPIFSLKIVKLKSDDKIISAFQKLIYNLCYSKEEKISLLEFKTLFSSEYDKFSGRKTNDSTMFLLYLFQYLHKNLNLPNKEVTNINEFSKLKLKNKQIEELEKFLDKYEKKNKSFIHDLFYGYQMNNMVCSGCYFSQTSFQSFNILDIPLMENTNKLKSLEQCLNCYLITRDQKDMKGFECSHCRKKLLSHQTSIIKLPPVLIINLKRVGEKVVYYHDIEIPLILKTKDMQKLDYFQKQYELIGFIKHYGNEKDGHNVAYCVNMFNKKWYSYNDTQVKELEGNPITDRAFLLFYQLMDNN